MEHGKNTSYQKGCRCEECRQAHRETENQRRIRLRAGRPRAIRRKYIVHGTTTGYRKGCRCSECQAASNLHRKRRNQEKQSEQRKAVQRAIDEQVSRMMQLAERIRA